MKANDLMVGYWVYNTHNRKNEQVAAIGSGLVMLDYNDLYEYDEIEPIPLTSEILEKNGFVLIEKEKGVCGVNIVPYYTRDDVPFEVFCDGKPFAVWFKDSVNIEYVHELQHALRLCGIEKEIEL